jgi:hypothetical protein
MGLFERIYSIEFDEALYSRAKRQFARFDHISIIQGNSADVLPALLQGISAPCLFWLDAHYCGSMTSKGEPETPIMKELGTILNHPMKNHVLLIDDARCFTGQNDYPSIEQLSKFVSERRPDLKFDVADDIMRIHREHA